MSTPSPITQAAEWDLLEIGPRGSHVVFTGRISWAGDALKRRLQKKGAPGRDGARIRDLGYDIVKLKLKLGCFRDEHFSQLDQVIAVCFPRGGPPANRGAVECPHPALAMARITMLYPEQCGVLEQVSPTLWEVELVFTEYRAEANRRNVTHVARPAPAGTRVAPVAGERAVPVASYAPTSSPPSESNTEP